MSRTDLHPHPDHDRDSGHAPGLDLDTGRAARARETIAPEFLDTPQFRDDLLDAALGVPTTVKLETANPLRCFKGRGVGYALRDLRPGELVVCASSGNFGAAVAYVARAHGATARVLAPTPVNPVKRARMAAFGADVVEVAGGTERARAAAATHAREHGGRLLLDGVDPALAEGAATLAEELCRTGRYDAIVVPVGDGSLASGVALWTRRHAPGTRVVGVSPSAAPGMRESWLSGEPVSIEPTSRWAEGISVPRPHPESLARLVRLLDDWVLVEEEQLRAAQHLAEAHLAVLAEPAGAAGLAAIASGQVRGDHVATVVTGANRAA